MKSKLILALGAAIFCVGMAGCGGDKLPSMAAVNDTNIKRVYSLYDIYKNAHGNIGPASQQELTSYITSDQTALVLLERMEISAGNIDDIFVSERDGKPFKIKWGVGGIANHAIIFEDTGVEGKRFVAFSNPRELDNIEYDGYWKDEIKPVAPSGGTTSLDDFMNQNDPTGQN